MKKSYQVLNKTDIGVLVVDSTVGTGAPGDALIRKFQDKGIPCLIVYNKCDLISGEKMALLTEQETTSANRKSDTGAVAHTICVSAAKKTNIYELKEMIASLKPEDTHKYPLIGDLMSPLDLIILVVPIDKAAPKGRLILPQQQTIRDIL